MKSLARWLVATLVVASGVGCVQIPDSSPVRPGNDGQAQGEPPPVFNLPDGPRPGADRLDIVEGFRAAMLASPRTSKIASEFLTPEAAAEWEPDAQTMVYEGQRLVDHDTTVSLTVLPIGALSERGVWQSAEGGEREVTWEFELAVIDGEWRIANPPQGMLVNADFFFTQRNYRAYSLYFLDASQRTLVPDPVFLPVGERTPTLLVENLLLGPTDSLKGVVGTAAPLKTIIDGSVSVTTDGSAEVPLSETVRNLSDDDRQLLAVQLAWTLRQFPQIKQFTITADGRPLEISGEGNTVDTDAFAAYDPAGFTASREVFGLVERIPSRIARAGASPLSADLPALVSDRHLAVDQRADTVAVVAGDGRSILVAAVGTTDQAALTRWCGEGVDFGEPSWDPYGVLWVVDERPSGSRLLVCTGQTVHEVQAPWARPDPITSFSVSRDGARVAAVVGQGPRSRLMVAAIGRDPASPARATLQHVREVSNAQIELTGLSSVNWMSPVSLAVLGQQAGDQTLPYDVRIDGSSVTPVSTFLPARPTTLATAPNGDAPFVVGTSNGGLLIRSDQEWLQFGTGVRVVSPTLAG